MQEQANQYYNMSVQTVRGQFIDIHNRTIYPAEITIRQGIIDNIKKIDDAPGEYILPGFVDAHVHIESSMLVPTTFAQLALKHGTVATVSDPHEIANVCGIPGIQYMIDNSKQSPLKFFFGAPSCVPATSFETAGAVIDSKDIETLLSSPDIWYLAEMMNFPGVLFEDAEVMAKIAAAKDANKVVDGHAPGLRGDDVKKYAAAGISTDHECFTIEEAKDKLAASMKILIREGSAAKNYEALAPLFKTHPSELMFCSDDKHPDELVESHINALVKRAVNEGYDLYDVLRAACINPVEHYSLPVGQLKAGDPADFIIIDDTTNFNVLQTYINGTIVAENGESKVDLPEIKPINNFNISYKNEEDFKIKATKANDKIRVIEALDGQLITNEYIGTAKVEDGYIVSDTSNDILKVAVVNRYDNKAPVSVAFIKNFGLKHGAIASTVGHDCHNIIVVGVDDSSVTTAVNTLVDSKGGICCVDEQGKVSELPLPIAGLMSNEKGNIVAEKYSTIDKKAKKMGSELRAPFMTLSFMALLVIPSLKLSDKGLFNGQKFEFTTVEA